MAELKKNQMTNIMFPMVDKTDFASIESGITASDFNSAATKKFYGVTHGNSTAFTSGTISKATTLVRSGIFQQTLKASETNYDYLVYRFIHPSCADQILVFQTVDNDDSDLMSRLSDIGSDLRSYLVGMSGMLSDVYSNLSDFKSDFQSRVPKLVATFSRVSDYHSDLRSYLTGMSGMLSDVYSNVSDFKSDFQSRVPKQVATFSRLSDYHSDLRSMISGITASVSVSDMSDIASRVWATAEGTRVDSRILVIQSLVSDVDSQLLLNASMISDVQSALDSQFVWSSNFLSDMHSDLRSQISGLTVNVTASDMSDIASRVWATAEGTRVDSRILVIQSLVSDVDSQLLLNASMISDVQSALDSQFVWTSAFLSDMNSDLSSQIGGITATITASDMSDIVSRVWGAKVQDHQVASSFGSMVSDTFSRTFAVGSRVSDIQSALDSQFAWTSNFLSGLSGLISDIDSQLLLNASMISDVDSQLLLNASMMSDTQSALDSQFVWTSAFLSDMNSDLASKIGGITATITASDISDIASHVWAAQVADHQGASSFGSMMSDIFSRVFGVGSRVSDIQSALDSQFAWTSNFLSGLSGLVSDVDSQLLLNASMISDVQSALDSQFTWSSNAISDMHSDLRSMISGITATVSTSDMSDIASRVWATAEGTRVDSRILVIQSLVSDVDSQLLLNASMISDVQSALDSQFVWSSNFMSDMHSDLRSQISGITASVSVSDMSDIASRVWATAEGTRVDSRILVIQSMVSDVDSQLLLNASMISDTQSALDSQFVWTSNAISDMHSDLRSMISGITASVSVSDMSDIASRVWATAEGTRVDSRILVLQSMVSDVDSQLLLNASMISDTQSALDSQFVWSSNFLSDMHSDLRSQISGITASVSVSDMSDIASRVWATAEGTRVDSRILVIQSLVSDVDSQLLLNASMISDTYSLLSDHHSDFQSRVAGALALEATLSNAESNILSYLAGISGAVSDIDSQLLLNASMISDVQSALDSQFAWESNFLSGLSALVSDIDSQLLLNASAISDVESAIDAGVNISASDMSDLRSAITAGGGGVTTSDMSDIASRVWATTEGTRVDSRILVIQSRLSDVESQLDLNASVISDVHSLASDISSRIPAALVGGRMSADVVAISGSTAAADNLEASAEVIVTGTAQTGTLSTTQMSTDLSEATDDHYIGRAIIWTSGVLLGQATDITDYVGVNGVLTFTAVTEAPSNGDTFVIV